PFSVNPPRPTALTGRSADRQPLGPDRKSRHKTVTLQGTRERETHSRLPDLACQLPQLLGAEVRQQVTVCLVEGVDKKHSAGESLRGAQDGERFGSRGALPVGVRNRDGHYAGSQAFEESLPAARPVVQTPRSGQPELRI